MNKISAESIRDLFYYKDGGLFYRRKHWSALKDSRFGHVRKDGYRVGSVNSVKFLEHRLIYLYHHGTINGVIDHINKDHTDNRIENLRDVSQVENCRNIRLSKNNTSGVTGVSFCNTYGKWKAYYTITGKHKSLGNFETKQEAVEARQTWEERSNWYDTIDKQ